MSRRTVAIVALVAVLAGGLGMAGVAAFPGRGGGDGRERAITVTKVSGDVTGAESCDQAGGVEQDLSVAVNPLDPGNVVAAWADDYKFIVVASSFDGGDTWKRTVVPGLTGCTGGDTTYMSHPRLSFGPDGLLWLAGEQLDGFFPDPRSGLNPIPVVTSGDGGRTWSAPTFVNEAPVLNGFNNIAAEPDVAGAAVVAWHAPEPAASVHMSRTTDGGASWETYDVGRSGGLPFLRILARAEGDLFLFMTDAAMPSFAGAAQQPLTVRRSTDKGQSWSGPVTVASHASLPWSSAAALEDGSIVVAYPLLENDKGFASAVLGEPASYVTQRSTDDGETWSTPVVIARQVIAPAPVLASTPEGVLGMSYTATADPPAPGEGPLDPADPGTQVQRLARSWDGGATWTHTALAGPFEPPANGAGYYAETAGFPGGFAAVFAQGAPGQAPSDVYVAVAPTAPTQRRSHRR